MGMREHWQAAWTTLKKPRWAAAMALALASDALSFGVEFFGFVFGPILQVAVDLATAVALILLLGFRWTLAVPLVVEAIPAVALFPTWTLAVAFYASTEKLPETSEKLPA